MIDGRVKILQKDEHQQGFTIVELLVVIVVIAILAAIAIVSYNGIQNRAIESSMKSDLHNGATALEIDKTTNSVYPVNASSANNGLGLKSSGTNVLTFVGGGSSDQYCLNITNPRSSVVMHIKSTDKQITNGPCGPWVATLAGSGVTGYAEGTGTAAQFAEPYGVAVDTSGNVYVADTVNHRIRKITPGGLVSTLAGSTSGYTDATGAAAQFRDPYGVAVDTAGNVYVADYLNHRIRKITPAGAVTTLAGSTNGATDGTGAAAQFSYPYDVALDTSGNVYVADSGNDRIRKITPAGVVTTLAGSTSGYVDATGTAARFSAPIGVAVDSAGNVYVADEWNNHRIRKITPAGVVTTLAGSTGGYADGTGAAAQFYMPRDVTVDSSGNVFVVDSWNNRIRKITPAGVVTTLAGTSTAGYAEGSGTSAQFNAPQSITIDSSGTLYLADPWNSRIRKITQ